MVKAKVFIFKNHFEGFPKESDMEVVEQELSPVNDGEFLAEALYISVDPYMRIYSATMKLGNVFEIGDQVARILESKNPNFPVGKYVVGNFGWRTHTVSNGIVGRGNEPWILPDLGELPVSLGIGILGMPGNSAYYGFLEICKPKSGETVVVSGAAGAVGNVVGQIAKIKGCKVVGIAGTDEKGEWLVKELGFDHFINYKTDNVDKNLSQFVPEGVDCYFDNVGGEISKIILEKHMKQRGRVSVCGAISRYNASNAGPPEPPSAPASKELTIERFMVLTWKDRTAECLKQHLQWIKEGKLKYRETVTKGFDRTLQAFIDMLRGGNIGKAIVKV